MPEISAVIITYNEEKNIERCIRSVMNVADEIIVVDSFSNDSTEKIAINLGAKFFTNKFEGYREQKNYAVTKANYSHILSLDADEALSSQLEESILKVKDRFDADGYTFNRLNRYCGYWVRHSNWYPDKKLRLFDSSLGGWKGINPHDKYMLPHGSRIIHLQGDLLHWVLDSYEAHIEKANNFSSIAAKEYFKMGRKTNVLKMTWRMGWRFFKAYILRGGFRDGYNGFVISSLSAYTSFLKYLKLRQMNIEAERKVKKKDDKTIIKIAGQ